MGGVNGGTGLAAVSKWRNDRGRVNWCRLWICTRRSAAKMTAQEFVERLQRAEQARPAPTAALSTPTPAPGCPGGNCVATVPTA
jgi:hypothetical protein